jgi:16S rRNA C967 or C1407 C5-methylase (RsmB/RsmF family)
MSAYTNAKPVALNLKYGSATTLGWQLLPSDKNTDGFFYAGLTKV